MASGFSDAERTAMEERAAELRAEKGGKKKARNLEALVEQIEAMPDHDKELAKELHKVVSEVAPHLDARTWYGMPAYELDGKVIVFLQVASKFDVRYSTLGFNEDACLDNGDIWPTSFAIPQLTDAVRDEMRALVKRGTPPPSSD